MSIYTLLSQSLLSESSTCPLLSAGQIWGTYFAEGQGSGNKEERELSTVGSYLPQDILAPWFLLLIVSSNATWAQDSVSLEGGKVFPSPSVACQACGAPAILSASPHSEANCRHSPLVPRRACSCLNSSPDSTFLL